MQIKELLSLSQSKLSYLNDRRNSLVSEWNIAAIIGIDEEINETENTINKLSSL